MFKFFHHGDSSFFFLLSGISLYGFTTFGLSNQFLMDIWCVYSLRPFGFPFDIQSMIYEHSSCSMTLLTLYIISLINFNNFNGYILVSYGFNYYFLND